MASENESGRETDAGELRAALRRGLTAALKARDSDSVAALRTAIAAIDNAEAVPAPDTRAPESSAHVAGARIGLGSAEADRCPLDDGQVRDILHDQISECAGEADRYDALGRADAAGRLRRQARTLATYLG